MSFHIRSCQIQSINNLLVTVVAFMGLLRLRVSCRHDVRLFLNVLSSIVILFRCILSYSFPYRKHIVLIVHCQSASALQTGQLRMILLSSSAFSLSSLLSQRPVYNVSFTFLTCVSSDAADLPISHTRTFCYKGSGTNTFPDPSSFMYWIPSFSDSMASFRSIFLFILMASLFLNSSA